MGEIILFVSKAERERARLIREARELYDSIFPSEHSGRGSRNKAITGHMISDANGDREGGSS